MIEFHAGAANFSWRGQVSWIGRRLAQRLGLDPLPAIAAARAVFRTDLYRRHPSQTGAALPGASVKLEGSLSVPTATPSQQGRLILPPDLFCDARIFHPTNPIR